jgi:hypothetical protein
MSRNIQNNKILGIFEPVSFPDFPELDTVSAKVDTGAFSGSLHCTNLEVKLINGEEVLVFSPFDHPEVTITAKKFTLREVKNSNGTQMRYFVRSKIKIKDQEYPIRLNLADRSQMKKSMLIGRRFLRRHGFVVDVSKTNS